jgi:hypothetical protein
MVQYRDTNGNLMSRVVDVGCRAIACCQSDGTTPASGPIPTAYDRSDVRRVVRAPARPDDGNRIAIGRRLARGIDISGACLSSGSLPDMMRPCGRVVAGAGLEPAVQDADDSVGELAQGGVVIGASGFELVVIGTGARRSVPCAEGLGHEGVGEPLIVHISGDYDLLLARGAGDRAGAGVVFADFASV